MSMALDRFTWFGLGLALLGWVALIMNTTFGMLLAAAGGPATAVLRSDVFTLSETAIVSGFALAIMGVLRAGFGALHAFFDAVLERADAPKSGASKGAAPKGAARMPAGGREAPAVVSPVESPADPVVDLEPLDASWVPAGAPGRAKPAAAAKPAGGGRNYTILANGAVEVDTLLGTRVFASLEEARAYIRQG